MDVDCGRKKGFSDGLSIFIHGLDKRLTRMKMNDFGPLFV